MGLASCRAEGAEENRAPRRVFYVGIEGWLTAYWGAKPKKAKLTRCSNSQVRRLQYEYIHVDTKTDFSPILRPLVMTYFLSEI